MNPEKREDYSDEAYEASLSSAIADKATSELFYEAN